MRKLLRTNLERSPLRLRSQMQREAPGVGGDPDPEGGVGPVKGVFKPNTCLCKVGRGG